MASMHIALTDLSDRTVAPAVNEPALYDQKLIRLRWIWAKAE